jgi:hypothetical protein
MLLIHEVSKSAVALNCLYPGVILKEGFNKSNYQIQYPQLFVTRTPLHVKTCLHYSHVIRCLILATTQREEFNYKKRVKLFLC